MVLPRPPISLTLHLSFYTLCGLVVGALFAAYLVVRNRYLTNYSRLPAEPQRKEIPQEVNLFTNTDPGGSKPGLHNYLDDFLSAIKVFGYLERPVFHELTRHMQTRKLLAGETLNLEDEKSFCLVVDGHIQVFFKADRSEGIADEYKEGEQGYKLLTDGESGSNDVTLFDRFRAPLSSMFSILTLFTEEVKLRHGSESCPSSNDFGPTDLHNGNNEKNPDDHSPKVGVAPDSPRSHFANSRKQSSYQSSRARASSSNLRDVPHFPLLNPTAEASHKRNDNSVHPGVIARANIDTTIAVIPAEAFRRLTRIFPKASAHIVQVIMTRFQRVTFATGHNYLGLTAEIIRTERQMNDLTTYELPNYVQASSLERLKQKIRVAESHMTGTQRENALVISSPSKRRPTSIRLVSLKKRIAAAANQRGSGTLDPPEVISIDKPGTLDATPENQDGMKHGDNSDDDNNFRDSVLHCMFKSLGLEQQESVPVSIPVSAEHSPKITSIDAQRQSKASFGSVLGNMAMLDTSTNISDGESESAFTSNSLEGIESEMDNDLEIIHFPEGAVLVEAQERNPGLYYVIDGFLDVGILNSRDTTVGRPSKKTTPFHQDSINPFEEEFEEADDGFRSLYLVKPGGIAGYQAGIGNYRSFVDVRAKTDVLVGFLPRSSLERIMEKKPVVLLTMAKRLISLLSPLILHLDFALEWLQVPAGHTIYQQDDDSDAIYIVLNGRVRSVRSKALSSSESTITGEYGNGESVGELEVLTDMPRPSSLHAVRETELARFPKQLFHSLALEHPGITIQISKLIAQRMGKLLEERENGMQRSRNLKSAANLRTICVLPISDEAPVMEFARRLSRALSVAGSRVTTLNQEKILTHLGRYAFSRIGKLRLSGHLADLEEKFNKILYIADAPVNSPWTQTCIGQADCVLLVAVADADCMIGDYERLLLSTKTTARKELVLLHSEKHVIQGNTRLWLRHRTWVTAHHHLVMEMVGGDKSARRPRAAQRTITTIKNKIENVQNSISKYTNRFDQRPIYREGRQKDDYARLARRLCGRTVGLVLGGGGARGLSHIGVIKAMEESGIPIDVVGGTSIGSFVGGLYARDGDLVPMYGRAKKFSGRMSGLWRFALDLTYPTISYTTGHEFNRGIWKAFGQAQIEDFWIPFFCNTTNITHSRMDIHTTGYAWRYVRASMSLAGLVPPMTEEGDMLCDGGYVDNLPVGTMRNLGADIIFAVDVGSVDDRIEMSYGDTLSGFWAIFNRWNPFSQHPNVPTLTEIQSRLAYSASVPALEKAKLQSLYMRPPVSQYGTLEFAKFDEIYKLGYTYAKAFLAEDDVKDKLQGIQDGLGNRKLQRRNSRPISSFADRRNSM